MGYVQTCQQTMVLDFQYMCSEITFLIILSRILPRIGTKFISLQATFVVLSKKFKKEMAPILLPSLQGRDSSFLFLIQSSKQRGIHLYHSTLGPLSLTSWQQAPRGDCPISVTKGYIWNSVLGSLHSLVSAFSAACRRHSGPWGPSPFGLKNSEFGQKRGRCHYLNPPP